MVIPVGISFFLNNFNSKKVGNPIQIKNLYRGITAGNPRKTKTKSPSGFGVRMTFLPAQPGSQVSSSPGGVGWLSGPRQSPQSTLESFKPKKFK